MRHSDDCSRNKDRTLGYIGVTSVEGGSEAASDISDSHGNIKSTIGSISCEYNEAMQAMKNNDKRRTSALMPN